MILKPCPCRDCPDYDPANHTEDAKRERRKRAQRALYDMYLYRTLNNLEVEKEAEETDDFPAMASCSDETLRSGLRIQLYRSKGENILAELANIEPFLKSTAEWVTLNGSMYLAALWSGAAVLVEKMI